MVGSGTTIRKPGHGCITSGQESPAGDRSRARTSGYSPYGGRGGLHSKNQGPCSPGGAMRAKRL
ncbi:hypothetical protein FOQG_03561 [Fusarium oxysporum f. sp. raphani 54005]|uniref:Uncharacterized protein n=2 Tax=Fusarium oxysporum TaxID=5507 RepID=X0DQH9_FUSOX|nr:hypothetical protein FOQG_03561 [Fusarium oxysporum f. sp. raphani 54005]EXL82523.1 hypothetical protein FOPG_04727 [Fusarium oxysporum f. sp. conglutinans race 2 54008]